MTVRGQNLQESVYPEGVPKVTKDLRDALRLHYKRGRIQLHHAQLMGMTSIMAGIMSATGKSFILAMRSPVATSMKPPQALKSLIISGVVRGNITLDAANRGVKMIT